MKDDNKERKRDGKRKTICPKIRAFSLNRIEARFWWFFGTPEKWIRAHYKGGKCFFMLRAQLMLEIFAADNIHLMETLPSQGVDIKRELSQIWMENFECKMSFHILYSA